MNILINIKLPKSGKGEVGHWYRIWCWLLCLGTAWKLYGLVEKKMMSKIREESWLCGCGLGQGMDVTSMEWIDSWDKWLKMQSERTERQRGN